MHFQAVDLLWEVEPRSAALNMALDEALLADRPGKAPLLRVYQWACPAVSYGYFEAWQAVAAAHPDREAVRRWTGGGVVLHGEDWTYSLLIPRDHPFARERPAESYRLIHATLAEAVAMVLPDFVASLTPETPVQQSRACFENPVRHDLLAGGRKVAGAAQRRTRDGILHQGSLQGVPLTVETRRVLAIALAQRLAEEVHLVAEPAANLLDQAEAVASARYGTADWNRRV